MEYQERLKQLSEQRCIFCGGKLSFDGQELVGTWRKGYGGDKTAMLHYIRCKECGRDYEVFDPTKEERENDYKEYWSNHPEQ